MVGHNIYSNLRIDGFKSSTNIVNKWLDIIYSMFQMFQIPRFSDLFLINCLNCFSDFDDEFRPNFDQIRRTRQEFENELKRLTEELRVGGVVPLGCESSASTISN